MRQVFALLSQVLKTKAYACFLVGRSIIHGKVIDNAASLEKAAAPNGFRKVARVERRILQTRKSFNPTVSTINQESIVVFQLEGVS
jgi:site-specific DNA-methyltransferase (cytosine-N4-specific)